MSKIFTLKQPRLIRISVCSVFLVLLVLLTQPVLSSELWPSKLTKPSKIKLQLKWSHQFQFAGYYMAQAKGFFREKGLSVELIPATPDIDPINEVLSGNADFGVGTSELLLNFNQGQPVVVLGVVFQHSPLALVTLESSNIDTVANLAGRTVMIEENSLEMEAFLKQFHIYPKHLKLMPHRFEIDQLINGSVDAISVYTTSETYELNAKQIPYRIFTPRMGGIDFYGDNFFTTQHFLQNNPDITSAFHSATIKGWKYAMSHIDETVNYIQQNYSSTKSREALKFEALAMQALMRTDLIEPGHMSDRRWQHIASVYQELGLLSTLKPLNDFLYLEQSRVDRLETKINDLILLISASAAVILIILFVARKIYRVKVQLKTMVNQAPMAILLLNDKFQIIEWNKQAQSIFGWQENEVLNRNIFEFLVIKAQITRVKQTLHTVFSQQKALHIENKNYHKDGRELDCNWSNAPFEINDKKYLICMAIDNSEFRDLKALSLKKSITSEPLLNSDSNMDFLALLVETMNLSLLIWEESSSKSKIQFAEESKLWKVTLDGSTAKTRTLDKYFSITTIPKNPRWKNVINTANFILRFFPEHPSASKLKKLKDTIKLPDFNSSKKP